jgi:hypothetical protein
MERCSRRKPAVGEEFSGISGRVSSGEDGFEFGARGRKLLQKSEVRLQKLRRIAGVNRVERSETIRSPQPKS